VPLIQTLHRGRQPFVIRVQGKVAVQACFRGRRKILSALSIALCPLADPRWSTPVLPRFTRVLSRLANGHGIPLLTAFSP
jgi:hypothetical protein